MRFLHSSGRRGALLHASPGSTTCPWGSPGARSPSSSQIGSFSSFDLLEHSLCQNRDGYLLIVVMVILQDIIINVALVPSFRYHCIQQGFSKPLSNKDFFLLCIQLLRVFRSSGSFRSWLSHLDASSLRISHQINLSNWYCTCKKFPDSQWAVPFRKFNFVKHFVLYA